jgi:peptidoglycan/LPS O-acetylase OafA/YrhL
MAHSGAALGAAYAAPAIITAQSSSTLDTRIVGLDGFRGLLTLMVMMSHYFAELPHGFRALSCGRIAVIGFFVLSGFLIGRMIIEKQHHTNFFAVFYVRRFYRIVPPYFAVLAIVYALYAAFDQHHWIHIDASFPWWSYVTFTQNFFMIPINSAGPRWLAPTWSLAVEEHFYLLMPLAMVLTPKRHLLKGLIAVGTMSLVIRIAIFFFGLAPPMAGHVLLPALMDTMLCGVIAAVLFKTPGIQWERYDLALRITPVVMLIAVALLGVVDKGTDRLLTTFGTTFAAIAAASLILAVVRDAPEAQRLRSRLLCFVGQSSYYIYLMHLAVLGMLHGLIFGKRPALETLPQFFVGILALPVAVLVGWLLYKLIEKRTMALGRRWEWSKERRSEVSKGDTKPADVSMATA